MPSRGYWANQKRYKGRRRQIHGRKARSSHAKNISASTPPGFFSFQIPSRVNAIGSRRMPSKGTRWPRNITKCQAWPARAFRPRRTGFRRPGACKINSGEAGLIGLPSGRNTFLYLLVVVSTVFIAENHADHPPFFLPLALAVPTVFFI